MLPDAMRGKNHTVVAGDVTAGTVDFYFDHMASISTYNVQVRTAAGALKAWDGAVTVTGRKLTVDNSGATDWAATDVIHVMVGEY